MKFYLDIFIIRLYHEKAITLPYMDSSGLLLFNIEKLLVMNIITNADMKKFLMLVQAGIKSGTKRELSNYNSASCYDGTNIAKEYYVNVQFSFLIERDKLEEFFIEDDAGLSNQIKEMINKEL